MTYTLGSAAKATGVAKSTIYRAIKAGTISARRADDGSYEIDPAELHRVYAPVSNNGSAEPDVTQNATRGGTADQDSGTVELAIANARLEAEIAGLRELLRTHRDQVDDLRTERDRLMSQVEASQRLLTHITDKPQRSWWPWRAA